MWTNNSNILSQVRGRSQLRELIVAVVLAVSGPLANAKVIHVNAASPPGGNGSTWASAFNSVDTALLNASSGDELWVVTGIYKPEGTVRKSFIVPSRIYMFGGFTGNETDRSQAQPTVHVTTLAGLGFASPNPVVILRDSTGCAISGFTIKDGMADGAPATPGGGGILVDSGSVEISACVFSNNQTVNSTSASDGFYYFTGSGGALCVRGGSEVSVYGCTFSNNSTAGGRSVGWYSAAYPGHGGAIYVERSSLHLRDSFMTSNFAGGSNGYCIVGHAFPGGSAGEGGAIFALDSQVTLTRDSFTSNFSGSSFGTTCQGSSAPGGIPGGGGALCQLGGTVEIQQCVFVANHSGYSDYQSAPGGAIRSNGTLVITNTRFLGNAAVPGSSGGGNGGAISSSGLLIAANSAFVGNSAGAGGSPAGDGLGGAVYCTNFALLSNCTVAANTTHNLAAGVYGAHMDNSIVFANSSTLLGHSLGAQLVGSSAWYSIVESWPTSVPDADGTFNADPRFVDLYGPDHVAGTIDDNPRLMADSPAIDSGDTNALLNDIFDLDNDYNTSEWVPFDLAGESRRVDAPLVPDTGIGPAPAVDRGAYEFKPACVGDLNNDGQVDDADFVLFAAAYNLLDCAAATMPAGCPSDVNHDLVVDDADFVIFVAAYNNLICP